MSFDDYLKKQKNETDNLKELGEFVLNSTKYTLKECAEKLAVSGSKKDFNAVKGILSTVCKDFNIKGNGKLIIKEDTNLDFNTFLNENVLNEGDATDLEKALPDFKNHREADIWFNASYVYKWLNYDKLVDYDIVEYIYKNSDGKKSAKELIKSYLKKDGEDVDQYDKLK